MILAWLLNINIIQVKYLIEGVPTWFELMLAGFSTSTHLLPLCFCFSRHCEMDRDHFFKVTSTNYLCEEILRLPNSSENYEVIYKSLEQTLDEHFVRFWSYLLFFSFLYL